MTERLKSTRQQACEVCGHTEFELMASQDRKGNPLNTVVCCGCGLVSHESIPTEEELEEYYRTEYRNDYNGETTPSDYRVFREWQRAEELQEILSPYLESTRRTLEIGSGIGCTVKHFELSGFESHGIEPGSGFCEYSRDILQANAVEGRWQDLSKDDQPFDLIMMVHVLEHLRDPRSVFAFVRDRLVDGGLFYVEVPNMGAPHAAKNKLFHYAHIYNYHAQSLELLGRLCGFEVEANLSTDNERNLRILFRRIETADDASVQPDDEGYRTSWRAFERYSVVGYHLRPSYLYNRFHQLGQRLVERMLAKQGVNDILERCEALSSSTRRAA